jgi:glutamate-1-semialdehyde aminotransferase
MNATRPTLHRDRRRSREIFDRAQKLLVGGVSSPVRAFRSVGGEPLIIERGEGQYLYDADGNQLLDYVCSWGAILLGHANPAISAAIADQAKRGTSFGVTTELEIELATLITRAIPFIEKIRFVSSGTEATMSAASPSAISFSNLKAATTDTPTVFSRKPAPALPPSASPNAPEFRKRSPS